MDTRQLRLIKATRKILHYRCSSDLTALLLEDALIKRYRPFFNSRQKKYLDYRYFKISDEELPRLLRLDEAEAQGNDLFGPFRDGRIMDRMEEILADLVGLRTCPESYPRQECVLFELERCLAPCRGPSEKAAYLAMLPKMRAFLAGSSNELLQELESGMQAAAGKEQFESAARMRDDLAILQGQFRQQAFVHAFGRMECALTRNGKVVQRFQAGNYIPGKHEVNSGDRVLGEYLLGEDRRLLLDRAQIVYRWIRRHPQIQFHFNLF